MTNITGTAGNDFIHWSGDGRVAPGGYTDNATATDNPLENDTITSGGGGNDIIFAGTGQDFITFDNDFTAADQVDGGGTPDGFLPFLDQLTILHPTDIVLLPTTIVGIEYVILRSDWVPDGTIAPLSWVTNDSLGPDVVNFSIGPRYAFSFDYSGENDTAVINVNGGNGNDVITGRIGFNDLVDFGSFLTTATGSDTFSGNAYVRFGGSLDATDVVEGFGGASVEIFGDYSAGLTLNRSMLSGLNAFHIGRIGGYAEVYNYDLTLASDLLGSGETLTFTSRDVAVTSNVTIDGSAETSGSFVMIGGPGSDTFIGGAGNDVFDPGMDTNSASQFNSISGGAGDDIIYTQANGLNATIIDGGSGNDTIVLTHTYNPGQSNGSGGNLTAGGVYNGVFNVENIQLGDGASFRASTSLTIEDGVVGAGKTMRIDGSRTEASFVVRIDASQDTNSAFVMSGGRGSDLLSSGAGADTLSGGGGADVLRGGGGADLLDGGTGADSMDGGAGADIYAVDSVRDVVSEAANDGAKDVVNATTTFALGENVDELNLIGSGARNGTGNAIANVLRGNGAANVLNGKAGADEMRGGGGDDLYFVDNAGDKVIEASDSGTDTISSSTTLALASNVENLILMGANAIDGSGNGLANTITGNSGNNSLNGGAGSDIIAGGAGRNSFLFRAALGASNVDTISDYTVADDTIRLDDAFFVGIGPVGALAAGAFRIGAAAADSTDRVIYDNASGKLYFDADGAGGQAQIHFATLSTGLAMNTAEFAVI